MATIDSGQLKKGLAIEIDGTPHLIVGFEFVKPGKGQALYKCKLKNLLTGQLYDRTYRSGETFQVADVLELDMQYLYNDRERFYFMNPESYEQIEMVAQDVGDAANFLREGTAVTLILYNNRAIGIELPNFVELEVTYAEPWLKGDTASGATKPVTVETGYTLQVPLFVNQGDVIKIDTRTGSYVERVKK